MKHLIPYLVLAGALLPAWGAEEEKPSYTLSSASAAPILHYTSKEGEAQPENTWLASNNVVTAFSCVQVTTNGTEAISRPTIAGNPRMQLTSCEAGFVFERIKPEVWFGGQIPLPTDTDWTKTYEYYKESAAEQEAFIFDPQNHQVFAKAGGTQTFTWFLKDGTQQSHAYIIATTCEGRPYRLFWTDFPYSAPPVSLSGRYIQLFGPKSIIEPTYGTKVENQGGQLITNNNVITSGVYLDSSSSCLYARGKVSGQFIVAFYDSGSYDNLQRIQVVEVGCPDVNYMTGYIGEPIQPYGMGYDTSGLIPSPVEVGTTAQDASGPYYYQHKGAYSYSPKNNWVYPLRTTTGEAWRLDVYWMETDAHGIQWPFERCNYSCSWNTNQMTTLITGAKVKLPQDYSVTLGGFQEPEGHALAPENQIFRTQKSGFSLLKVSATDNVWFIPVRSIDRTDTNFFTLEEAKWFVGDELRPRGGSVKGTSETYNPVIDSSVSGWLNLDESSNNYNADLYYDWTTTSNTLASVIYPVNTVADSAKPLEVWWSSTVQQEGMTAPISFPSLVQRYRAIWPEVNQVPQIVIASQEGGSGTTRYEAGSAASFSDVNSTVGMPDLYAFNERGGSISFWANVAKSDWEAGRILTLGSGDGSAPLKVYVDSELVDGKVAYSIFMTKVSVLGHVPNLVTTPLSTNEWHKIVFSFAPSNLTAFVDGKFNVSTNFIGVENYEVTSFGGKLKGNYMGYGGAAKGLFLDNVALWARTFDETTASNNFFSVLKGTESALTCAFTFDNDDLEVISGTEKRKATDIVSGRTFEAEKVLRATPGAPILGNGIFTADNTPIVYRQPDKTKAGYNPNEEHAFVASGAGGYYAWALRCDLNTDDTSKPFVLVQYEKDGEAKMECYSVLLTNELHTALAANVEAGHLLPGPHPLDLLDNPWCTNDYWDVVSGQAYSSAYRDRKGQVWARSAGTIPIHMYYPNQDGFDYPSLSATPAVGVPIPWLSELGNTPSAYMLSNKPATWTWTVTWPTGVPTMRIGETLTTAANGLPEVWSAKSMAVLWPQGNTDTVKLWDPTVARESGKAGYDKVADLLSNYGFSVEAGNVQLRAGKYTFKELPPSIGSRFYADTTKDSSQCITLIGELESSAGGKILWPNVANAAEIAALKGLISEDMDSSKRTEWATIIDGLTLTAPIQPTTIEGALDPVATYIPRDHYALTAMGGTGYVTIIENDAPVGSGVGQLGVQDGDAISMHVFAVTNKYYTGRVVAREDQENLLSQQLSILYTESFAGTADDYEFEWKKATPTASGVMPTDYTNAYKRAFSNEDEMRGLTRFTLGGQGDTLANLVNTFYVMRYRAVSGAAKTSMGDTWSDWCGPTLAEGWIQRVVNNVTPFTQRMTNLYENEAETLSSMIQQAGGPYMGDVALNQDNLTSVGLIQLYQTLLNKAESISIAGGSDTNINDAEVNKQLLLAAERLADLYMVLGNDAYADALNPTIGFGTTWGETAAGISQIDYGAESTGLFCFDNQVSSLLEEELALLRGRSGANNPSVQNAPYYNRLMWNFTRGITAGEVAYAVNYNINSSNNDAKINEDDAALQYPQGHGDAWGHYLSAISTFYRLLRNPNFTWPVSQSQMLVADAVVDVDYYDEERFAEIANKLAVTAADVVDRTARKAWRDNGGANGAGYLDEDTKRNFGYGEWATRGAIGGVANWMVANAILPETESSDAYSRLVFGENTFLYNTNVQLSASSDFASGWTFEFQVAAPTNTSIISKGTVLSLAGSFDSSEDSIPLGEPATDGVTATQGFISLSSTGEGTANLLAENRCYYVIPVTNKVDISVTNEQGVVSTIKVDAVDYVLQCKTIEIANQEGLNFPDNALVAIDRAVSGAMTLRILNVNGNEVATSNLGTTLCCEKPLVVFGGGFTGSIGEIRGWKTTRSNAQLQSARAYVNARDENLLFYTRGTTRRTTDTELADETPGGDIPWTIQSPNWASVKSSGLALAFDDDGLVRINRDTVTDLANIPTSVYAIQNTLDGLDAGMNPLGLSDSAVPFDISSTGVAEGTATHFEQIAARAEKALGNASKMLDRAQSASKYLRQIQNATSDEEELAATSEKSYEAQLIEIFGTPYSGDIGPGKMYEQGYTGPDLYHYMYMDLSGYGLTSLEEASPKYVLYYNPSSTGDKWTYDELEDYFDEGKNTYSNALVYCVSEYGIVVKPDSVTGSRSAYGRLQQAYSDYLLAYVDVRNAVAAYNEYTQLLKVAYEAEESIWSTYNALYGMSVALRLLTSINIGVQKVTQNAINAIETVRWASDLAYQVAGNSVPRILVAGLSVGFSPQTAVDMVVGNANVVLNSTINGSKLSLQTIQTLADFIVDEISNGRNGAQDAATWNDAQLRCWEKLYDAASKVRSSAKTVKTAVAKLNSLTANFDTLVAEGNRILAAREAERAKRVNRIIKLRYNDMFFRQVQDEALTGYSAAYNLAQRQVFMAAQTYDYETAQLTSDKESGDAFKAEIVGARALGTFDSNGKPQVGSGHGDAGLSDILARMEANYDVLKPRLGINNPDSNATWFSLRHELFRIDTTEEGLANWQKELQKYVVADLRQVPEYNRFCQPVASTSGLSAAEPALVIPFETTIDFGKNLFGRDLIAGDHSLDSSYYATKIRSTGVRFVNYNAGTESALAATPVVYLVPVGVDRMRVPGDLNGTVVDRPVVDQVIPVPYTIGSTALDDIDYTALASSYTGCTEPSAKIRRIPSFRAMTGSADDADRANTRLIGRSAWNTRWVLIIPAGQLLGGSAENKAKALDIFINGADTNNDGALEVSPVTDIELGLKTYSHSGN